MSYALGEIWTEGFRSESAVSVPVFTSWTVLAMLTTGASLVWCPASTWIPEELDSTPECRVTQRAGAYPWWYAAGRAGLDPWRTVRVGDVPSSFQAGKTGKTVNCIDYRPSADDRERILQAPGLPRR